MGAETGVGGAWDESETGRKASNRVGGGVLCRTPGVVVGGNPCCPNIRTVTGSPLGAPGDDTSVSDPDMNQ